MKQQTKTQTIFYGSLIILQTFLWGVGNPIVKIGLETIPPFYCTAIRFAFAFLLFMLFFGKQIVSQMKKEYLKSCIIIGLFTGASFIFSTLCMLYTTATTAGFLLAFAVVFTPVLSLFILKKRISKMLVFVIFVVLIGMYFLCGNDGTFHFGLGELLALLSSLAGAGMLTYSSKHVENIGPMALSASQAAVSAILSFIFAFLFEDFHALADTTPVGWACVAYLAIACTCIAYMLQNIALKHVSATFVSLAFCAEPIFTAIAAYFMLREILSLSGIVGAVLIMVGICIASLLPSDTPEEKKPDESESQTE